MTREELYEAVEKAKGAKNVALAEVTATHDALIAEAEAKLREFDESQVTEAEVEAVVEGENPEAEVPAFLEESEALPEDVVVSDEVAVEVTEEVPSEEPVEEVEEEDLNSPTAEEEEILRRAAEIEAKYQK